MSAHSVIPALERPATSEKLGPKLVQPQVPRSGGALLIIDFGANGNSEQYRTEGWSGQEQTYIWSTGGGCALRLPPPVETGPLLLDFDLSIVWRENILSAAIIRIFVNDVQVGQARLTGRTRLTCPISGSLVTPNDPIDVRIVHPCFARIDYLGEIKDDRVLGLCFYKVLLVPPWLLPAARLAFPVAGGASALEAGPQAGGQFSPEPWRAVYHLNASHGPGEWLRDGWRFDSQGNAWAAQRFCYLELPALDHPGRYAAIFKLSPLFVRNVVVSQRISIILAGAVIGQFQTGTETSIAVAIPPELIPPASPLRFTFALPDGLAMHEFKDGAERYYLSMILDSIEIMSLQSAHAPWADLREDDVRRIEPVAASGLLLDEPLDNLPAAVKQSLGADLGEIVRNFESLGDNCGFGLAQRKAGGDVLGLLRFASTPLSKLLTALDDEFQVLTDKSKVVMRWQPSDPGEFIISSDEYGIRWHTDVHDENADQAQILGQQAMRLSYLRRKYYESLRAGRKVMVIARAEPLKHPIPLPAADEPDYWEEGPEPLRLAEIIPLFNRLNQYGTNTILFVTLADKGRRPGTVELLAPGLMRGYVDSFVISNDLTLQDHASWMRVVVNAWNLHQGANKPFHAKSAP